MPLGDTLNMSGPFSKPLIYASCRAMKRTWLFLIVALTCFAILGSCAARFLTERDIGDKPLMVAGFWAIVVGLVATAIGPRSITQLVMKIVGVIGSIPVGVLQLVVGTAWLASVSLSCCALALAPALAVILALMLNRDTFGNAMGVVLVILGVGASVAVHQSKVVDRLIDGINQGFKPRYNLLNDKRQSVFAFFEAIGNRMQD